MKKLVLYCSIDGNTDAVAHAIADKIDADMARLVRVKKVKGFGFFNNLKLRMEVMGKKNPIFFRLNGIRAITTSFSSERRYGMILITPFITPSSM